MSEQSFWTFLVLGVVLVTRPVTRCFPGPANCAFEKNTTRGIEGDLCGWNGDFVPIKISYYGNLRYVVRSNWYNQRSQLQSRAACSTQGQTFCLSFVYVFAKNDTVDLSVYVQADGVNPPPQPIKLWTASTSRSNWDSRFILHLLPEQVKLLKKKFGGKIPQSAWMSLGI
jgi:hypothetical protein